MKAIALLFLGLIFASITAHAGTLGDTLCNTTAICHNVPNAGGAPIDYLHYDWAHARVLASIGGRSYDSGLWALPNGALSWSYLPLVSADGKQIFLTATFKTWATRSGRTLLTHWELVGGAVTP